MKKSLTLSIPDQTLYVLLESGSAPIAPTEVLEVVTFKTDHLTVDCIWLRLTLSNYGACDLSEDHPDFQRLATWLQANGMLADEGWRERVMQPAFARNESTLYKPVA